MFPSKLKAFPFLTMLLLLYTIFLCGCSPAGKVAGQTSGVKPLTINASYVSRPINIPSTVAKEKKLFENEFAKDGIAYNWRDITTPSNQLEALAAKSLDFANSLNFVSAILAKANGIDIKIIAAYSRFPKGIALVVKQTAAIRTTADLKGKKIALQKGTMLHEMLIRALSEVNLTSDDLELVDMDSTAAAAAIAAGQVDAAILPEPLLSKALASGKARKIFSAEGLIPGLTVIAVRSEFAETQPELVKRYLKVHQDSITWSHANRDEAIAITAKQNQIDEKTVRELYPEFSFDMSLDQVKNDLLHSASFLQNEGLLSPKVDINKLVDNLIDPSYLPK